MKGQRLHPDLRHFACLLKGPFWLSQGLSITQFSIQVYFSLYIDNNPENYSNNNNYYDHSERVYDGVPRLLD